MTTTAPLDTTRVHPNPDIVFGDVDGDIVALNMTLGSYLHLNSSGSFIFGLLDGREPQTIGWLFERVRTEYDVDADTCHREVREFVARCVGLDLLRLATDERA